MKIPLTEEQTHKLLKALREHHLETMLTLALLTGIQRHELLSIQWRHIDLEHRKMQIPHASTKSCHQQISLPECVVVLLRQHRQHQIEAQGVAGTAWLDRDLVFSNQTGGFLGSASRLQGWQEILEQAGLPPLQLQDVRVAVW